MSVLFMFGVMRAMIIHRAYKKTCFQGGTRLPWGPGDMLLFNELLAFLVTM
jgi:hypothetical protein